MRTHKSDHGRAKAGGDVTATPPGLLQRTEAPDCAVWHPRSRARRLSPIWVRPWTTQISGGRVHDGTGDNLGFTHWMRRAQGFAWFEYVGSSDHNVDQADSLLSRSCSWDENEGFA
jgi:hypothetical protein